mgnify:CR=1 FL=1
MEQHRTLKMDTSTLWKVTLGFLPFYVNLNKRLYDEHETAKARQMEDRTTAADDEENDIVLRDIKEVLTNASTRTVPEAEWSDISESSTDGGWSDSDTEYHSGATSGTSCKTSTSKSVLSYSGSEWAFAWPAALVGESSRSEAETESGDSASESGSSASESSSSYRSAEEFRSEYVEWRKDPDSANLSWMEKISKAFAGSSSCQS